MNCVNGNIRQLYSDFSYGDFGCRDGLKKIDPSLSVFLSKVKKNEAVFDIGCGAGFWMDKYISAGVSKDQITGVDIALRSVELLKKMGFNMFCGDILNLGSKDNVSDFTICNGVIHHTVNPFKAFSELVRITKHGGFIYLSVYNRWSPYFYIVHKATYPIRYYYWNWNKGIINFIYPVFKILFRPAAFLLTGESWNDKKWKIVFMDQVMTPRASLFSKATLSLYAKKCNCEIEQFDYFYNNLMVYAIIKVVKNKE